MNAQLILNAKDFKNNVNPSASLHLELCNFARLREITNNPNACIRKILSGAGLKVFYYA